MTAREAALEAALVELTISAPGTRRYLKALEAAAAARSMPKPASPWEDDAIQFPRLLAEINACWEGEEITDLCASMDLEVDDINELFDRAEAEWDRIKRAMFKKAE